MQAGERMRGPDRPVDSQERIPIADLFPIDPCWRFGAFLNIDRGARELRRENQRRQADWFNRPMLSSTGNRAA